MKTLKTKIALVTLLVKNALLTFITPFTIGAPVATTASVATATTVAAVVLSSCSKQEIKLTENDDEEDDNEDGKKNGNGEKEEIVKRDTTFVVPAELPQGQTFATLRAMIPDITAAAANDTIAKIRVRIDNDQTGRGPPSTEALTNLLRDEILALSPKVSMTGTLVLSSAWQEHYDELMGMGFQEVSLLDGIIERITANIDIDVLQPKQIQDYKNNIRHYNSRNKIAFVQNNNWITRPDDWG